MTVSGSVRTALILALLGIVASCGGGASSPEENPATVRTVNPTTTTSIQDQVVDFQYPCSLLTSAEVEEITNQPVVGYDVGWHLGRIPNGCDWVFDDGGSFFTYGVIPSGGRQVYDTEYQELFTDDAYDFEPLQGVGDEAHIGRALHDIVVVEGDALVSVTYFCFGCLESTRDQSIALATLILSKLD